MRSSFCLGAKQSAFYFAEIYIVCVDTKYSARIIVEEV